jgi:hypothetical protein
VHKSTVEDNMASVFLLLQSPMPAWYVPPLFKKKTTTSLHVLFRKAITDNVWDFGISLPSLKLHLWQRDECVHKTLGAILCFPSLSPGSQTYQPIVNVCTTMTFPFLKMVSWLWMRTLRFSAFTQTRVLNVGWLCA